MVAGPAGKPYGIDSVLGAGWVVSDFAGSGCCGGGGPGWFRGATLHAIRSIDTTAIATLAVRVMVIPFGGVCAGLKLCRRRRILPVMRSSLPTCACPVPVDCPRGESQGKGL